MDAHPPPPTAHSSTVAISAGRGAEHPGDPLNVPPSFASSFRAGSDRSYVRGGGSPSIDAFEEVLGRLEGGTAVAFGSGMAAIAAALDRLPAGGRLTIPSGCYHGSVGLAEHLVATRGGRLTRIAQHDTDAWLAAVAADDVVLLESPDNPLLRLADVPTICAATARRAQVVVDNTLATPLGQRPLDLGADVVVHSATKAIGGHADLLLGVAVARDQRIVDALRRHRVVAGATPGAMETFLATRGLRTLPLRHRQAQANAAELARWLEAHPAVTTVSYPGLASHPDQTLAATALTGPGTMIAFEVVGDAAQADAVCAQLRLVVHATSLGGIESSMERRAAVPGQEHLPPTLLRLSVGCEDVGDLVSDLDAALSVTAGRPGPSGRQGPAVR